MEAFPSQAVTTNVTVVIDLFFLQEELSHHARYRRR
jgi:hypothetical protein